ncbi:MAG: hypothetical protein OXP69_07605 [Spirochaetaceae bacterium]|nr:hypothetical protein [Spirochaetaceae bacterium]
MNQRLFSQRNWIKKEEYTKSGVPPTAVIEYDAYSDARFTGQVDIPSWPYAFLNVLSSESGTVDTRMILRVEDYEYYADTSEIDWSKTHDDAYHGGWYDDEIVSLASLILGVRLVSGGPSRRWHEPVANSYGQPERFYMKPKPFYIIRGGGILPDATGEHSMMRLEDFDSIRHIDPKRFVSLVRACSLYRNALWMVEMDANLAWLLFVSALEAVATSYGSDSRSARMTFTEFVVQFRPDPPKERPSGDTLQFEWTEENFSRMLKLVYDYRSRALHGGKPFPAPMLDRPWPHSQGAPAEVPGPGLGMSMKGGSWRKKELPINLHTFHYITRHSLLNWWDCELSKYINS